MYLFGLPLIVDLWILLAVVLMSWNIDRMPQISTVCFFIALVYLQWVDVIDLKAIPTHAPELAKWTALYILVGVLWSVAKWKFYVDASVNTYKEKLKEVKEWFLLILAKRGEPIDVEADWKNWIKLNLERGYRDVREPLTLSESFSTPPNAPEMISENVKYCRNFLFNGEGNVNVLHNKLRISLWAIYWPFSMLWTLINDPFAKLYQYILFVVVRGVFEKIATNAKNKVDKELNIF